ncbi:MAG: hypothetical protein WAW02_04625 [Sideroxyarcus sp.]
MSQLANQQLDAIHSMLSAGHRNLRIERHSLILWGLICGAVILGSDDIITREQFPVEEQRAFAWLIFLGLVVSGVALVDWHLTRRAKQVRDEAWSFIHRQVLKVMWLLMAVAVLLTFSAFFFGGGYLIFSEWVVLVGLGLYVHGLFSEQLLEWVGALMISIGIAMVAFRLNYTDLQWVAASTLGLGMPLLSVMLDRGRERTAKVRLLQSLGWLLCVLIPPLLAHKFIAPAVSADAPIVSYEQFQQQPNGRQIVALQSGMTVPVKFDVSGNLFRANSELTFPLVLNEPLLVMMDEGKPTGEIRAPSGNWMKWQDSFFIHIPKIATEYDAKNGAGIRSSLIVKTTDGFSH